MADLQHRPRPSPSSNATLWLMAGVSLLLHLSLLSLAGIRFSAPPIAPANDDQISIRLQRQPAPAPPKVERLADSDNQGSGNTAAPKQLLSRSAPQRQEKTESVEPGREPQPARPITRSEPAPAVAAPTPSNINTGSLLAQVGALSRAGDNAAIDSNQETGRDGNRLGDTARGYVWARYQADWRLKVEKIGNLNYPAEAKRQGLHGSVTLEVTLSADGNLQGMRVSRSSGSQVLDEAAQRVVELSSPFAPFPPGLSGRYPSLRLSQKFVFTRDNLLSSH
ncbi:energy transducer TonB [Chromobacterium sp. IIBBL 290-4]|uniref:energy transducer TonB n=1 Tax=Chromobacterium sp. IIBBL 290-4 TaxID=2953890 RepID=UPI0020B8F8C8|nr:energy transducer TonB [Chromobacterium sp. IIBBL 290-4]UTH75477.1 energy transducer TonB [Chromobacterium sp. IIBBL 290-4]